MSIQNELINEKEPTKFYLKIDVLLLTDLFQSFIIICKSAYDINTVNS